MAPWHMLESSSPERDPLTSAIIGAAIEVHRNLGPGLLESIYEACLAWELRERGHSVEQQVAVPVTYKGHPLRFAYRVDLVVERSVIVEVKAVDRLHQLTDAQVLTYLKLAGLKTALVLNFNVALLRDGVRRLVL
jgi:GxxExxY protein